MKEVFTLKTAAIFYFSGTGNTYWVAKNICNELLNKGIYAKAYSIETLSVKEANDIIEKNDLVGFGYPVFGSYLPKNFVDFIDNLDVVNGKKCFVFCSVWLFSGGTVGICTDMLKRKGFCINWGTRIFMPNNVCVKAIPFPYTVDFDKINNKLSKAQKRINFLTEKIIKGQPFIEDSGNISRFCGWFQRKPFVSFYEKMQNDISVDKQKCVKCLKCVKLCPVNNLYLEGDNILTKGICNLCLRCYDFCPSNAIKYMNKTHPQNAKPTYKGPTKDFDPYVLIKKDDI